MQDLKDRRDKDRHELGRVSMPQLARKNVVKSWLRDMVVSVLVSGFIIMFLYQPVRVEGTSMLPMLEDQDRLFVNKMAYRMGDIHRGDVVVFKYPGDKTLSSSASATGMSVRTHRDKRPWAVSVLTRRRSSARPRTVSTTRSSTSAELEPVSL